MITPSEVVEYAFTPREQISPQVILPMKIDIACEHFIRPKFGDELYDKFKEGQYAPFVEEYLKPAIAYYVRYALIDELSIQMSDKGAVLFESEQQESQQTKSSTTTTSDSATWNNLETHSGQKITDTLKTTDTTTEDTATKTAQNNSSQSDDRHTVSDKSINDTLTRESTTASESERIASLQTNLTVNESTNVESLRNDDYSYHEAPVTIGVGREGYTHETLDDEKKVMSTKIGADNTTDDLNGSVKQDVKDNKTVAEQSEITSDNTLKRESAQNDQTNATRKVTGEDVVDQKIADNRTVNAERESSGMSDKKSEDTGELNNMRHKSRPASDFQRNVIKARALADANILISKAVRYVERNNLLFPEYRPLPRSYGRIVI